MKHLHFRLIVHCFYLLSSTLAFGGQNLRYSTTIVSSVRAPNMSSAGDDIPPKTEAASKCVPCSSLDPSTLLSQERVEQELESSLPLWELQLLENDIPSISRKFTAKNFQCALDCINAMGAIAEREGHHPDFHLTSYRDVEVVLYTHKLQGVTANDLQLAGMLDEEVDVVYSPKWLRENPHANPKVLE